MIEIVYKYKFMHNGIAWLCRKKNVYIRRYFSCKIMTIILLGYRLLTISLFRLVFRFIITFFFVCGSINGHAGWRFKYLGVSSNRFLWINLEHDSTENTALFYLWNRSEICRFQNKRFKVSNVNWVIRRNTASWFDEMNESII